MRKLLWVPTIALIAACGGGGFGDEDFSYPNSRTMAVNFKNTTATPVKLWLEPDETEPAFSLAPNSARTINVSRTWDSESKTFVFTFKGLQAGFPTTTTTLSINGRESHASNFHGFLVEWRSAAGVPSMHCETQ